MSTVECPSCGHDSEVEWRCEECGHDLADESTDTSGMEARRNA
jgi:uncharacterized membrane protein YvbJ